MLFRDDVFFDTSIDLFWDLQEFERLIDFYNFRKSIPDVFTDNQRDRLNELIATRKIRCLLGNSYSVIYKHLL